MEISNVLFCLGCFNYSIAYNLLQSINIFTSASERFHARRLRTVCSQCQAALQDTPADVARSFWLPADMVTFIQLSLTSRDELGTRSVDQYSANERIISERSMTFDNLLSEIDASPGSRILVVGQAGIGKTTLLQMITRSWAHDRALSSCWILLHIILRDLVLLQHAPNLTTFLSFMGNTWLPPDIETFVFESDGKGLCFIADGLDEYPASYI